MIQAKILAKVRFFSVLHALIFNWHLWISLGLSWPEKASIQVAWMF